MRSIGLLFAILFVAACNNSANETNTKDSAAIKDNTNVYDTGVGSSMTDTSRRMDTSLLPNKMQDTGMKK
ncbi:MAG TPA: hypothetical protein VGQ09_14305 [Chitinophagaceae bacterium]|jgi:hypothetical protein|nr:hypothetical protein [Chitinophagaceae bacterium]